MEVDEEVPSRNENTDFVTVVSIGDSPAPDIPEHKNGYVTVLTIGDAEDTSGEIIEEVLVYRLPGERLGFGLKFEGGTKAAEFVKRLFIQSCAPDSPASRVTSSWGQLTEGDEVLEIDSLPVKTMTRIDCVRCLKDSNVVIKLLVKHSKPTQENLPQVVSAEKKRTPPPPPPVPPRKIPRKLLKDTNGESPPVPPVRQTCGVTRFQSPRNSGRFTVARDRRVSDGSIGPPDPEVYTDLFLQESTYSLSESDDTGSSISTVVDRLSSIPTTTNSSFAGSLPSTPTSIQKHLDLSHFISDKDDLDDVTERKSEGGALQPPMCFQDAPLSYGNEFLGVNGHDFNSMDKTNNNTCLDKYLTEEETEKSEPPPPPPRTRVTSSEKYRNDQIMILPRLVDFVPKSNKPTEENSIQIMTLFLENEKRNSSDCFHEEVEWDIPGEFWNNEYCNFNWNGTTQLATIGEDEEEANGDFQNQRRQTPIVIVDTVDNDKVDEIRDVAADDDVSAIKEDDIIPLKEQEPPMVQTDEKINEPPESPTDTDGKMEAPPTYSRQPPDGHEFPDYQETDTVPEEPCKPKTLWKSTSKYLRQDQLSAQSVRDKIAIFSNNPQTQPPPFKSYKSSEDIFNGFGENVDSLNKNKAISKSVMSLDNIKSSLNHVPNSTLPKKVPSDNAVPKQLHTRSQSLIDMSVLSEQRTQTLDRWSLLVEQRKKGLSKLKGLVIPEQVNETDSIVDLPEIKSNNTPIITISTIKPPDPPKSCHTRNSSTPNLTWTTPASTIPKYSPAFKRKSLQVYATPKIEQKKPDDAPKSLESITSPTQSDCSFEYISTSPELKQNRSAQIQAKEDDSDNDSAVSSSQSSYISPPASPTHLHFSGETCNMLESESTERQLGQCDLTGSRETQVTNKYDNRRLLKPRSVEAINRKNILASAKCRSGRNLKAGSPLIQRKFNEEENKTPLTEKISTAFQEAEIAVEEIRNEVKDCPVQTKPSLRETFQTTPAKINQPLPLPKALMRHTRSANVTDLRKSFEKLGPVPAVNKESPSFKSSISPSKPIKQKQVETKPLEAKNDAKLDNLKPIEKSKTTGNEDVKIIVLRPEVIGGSVGITLAGGTDYETKEITVHKIRDGSAAFRNGQLQKGDRIISINGTNMKGLTHEQSVATLRERVPEITIVAQIRKNITPDSSIASNSRRNSSSFHNTPTPKEKTILNSNKNRSVEEITLIKDIAGLGFSVEGGHDSPLGDLPLLIKKIFKGGAAEKCNKLYPGDELVSINNSDVTCMSRIDAWALMKKLPEGNVVVGIRR